MPLVLLPLMLLVVPIAEITVFILVGNLIGLWPTIGLVIGSAIIGTLLLRRQGLSTLMRIQAETQAGRMPGRELVHGVMILVAGVLLLTPGLITDAIGYLLFVPAIRDLGWRFLRGRVGVMASARTGEWRAGMRAGGFPGMRSQSGPGGPGSAEKPQPPKTGTIDLTPEDFERRPDPRSPWANGRDGTLH